MRVFIAGIDGYLGWPLAQFLAKHGYEIGGLDSLLRRHWVSEVGGQSAIPISSLAARISGFRETYGQDISVYQGNILDYGFLVEALKDFQPDTVVHLGQMPSATYSMIDQSHAVFTQHNNVIGNLNMLWAIKETCPDVHLIKLGTMGEYGTPNIDIPEGFFEVAYRGRKDYLPFPRQAGSFYHWSKVHDSNNTMFACKIWNLRVTDIMQGIVFGTRVDETMDKPFMRTRLDFDQCFGTVVNRFCCQAIVGHPLTVFGAGQQTRTFLPLKDSMQCLGLIIENPAKTGCYRVINQFGLQFSINELAMIVHEAAKELRISTEIQHLENPRQELSSHYYNPDRTTLDEMGYTPTTDIQTEVSLMLQDLLPHRDRILEKKRALQTDIRWDGRHIPVQPLETNNHSL